MARRGYSGYGASHDPDEREVVTPLEEIPSPDPVSLTPEEEAKQQELNKLDAYYAKVMGDLDREEAESHAVHDATEKRCDEITAQRAHVEAEYTARKAEIQGEPPPTTRSAAGQSRWGGRH